jgi:ankyrin repeat protein
MSRLFATDVPEDEDWENSDFQHDLAAAAALLNRPALLKRVLEESCDLEVRPGRLPPPYISAAQAGHHEILDLLFGQKESFFHLRRQRAFTAAAESGRAQTVKYILKAPWIPWSLEDPKTRDSQALKEGLCTPDMDTFNIILEARQNTPQKGPLDEYELHRLLLNAVRKGWTFMARHLLWLGAPIDVPLYERDKGDFVLYACKGGFGDTVRLLLDHGAHATGGALRMAADCGYSDIVRMLLEHGVKAEGLVAAAARKGHLPTVQTLTEHGQNLDEGLGPETVWGFEPPAIVWAVELEHERMFRYLVTQGARIDTDESGGEAVRRAKNAGLESMLTLLEEYGVDRRTDLPSGDQVKKSLQE